MKVIVEINEDFETAIKTYAANYGIEGDNVLVSWLKAFIETEEVFFANYEDNKHLEWSIKPVD